MRVDDGNWQAQVSMKRVPDGRGFALTFRIHAWPPSCLVKRLQRALSGHGCQGVASRRMQRGAAAMRLALTCAFA
jgi:hypothetical protein